MKNIDYRGKDKDGNWIYGFYVHFRDLMRNREAHQITTGYSDSMPESNGISFCGNFEDVDPKTLGRFTGVEDKNGNPIYEGDIVRYRWTDERFKKNPKYTIAVVEWDKWNAGWGLKHCISVSFRKERLEVLGNIHDNPNYPGLKTKF